MCATGLLMAHHTCLISSHDCAVGRLEAGSWEHGVLAGGGAPGWAELPLGGAGFALEQFNGGNLRRHATTWAAEGLLLAGRLYSDAHPGAP